MESIKLSEEDRQELYEIISKNKGLTIDELAKKGNKTIANTKYDLESLEEEDWIRIEKRVENNNIKRYVYLMEE